MKKVFLVILILISYQLKAQDNSSHSLKTDSSFLTAYPVIGAMQDTLFYINQRVGSFTSKERAISISGRIKELVEDDFFISDSLKLAFTEFTADVIYYDRIIMSITQLDAQAANIPIQILADQHYEQIKFSLIKARSEKGWIKVTLRILLVLLVLAIAYFIFVWIKKGNLWLIAFIEKRKDQWLKDLSYKDYTFLSADQELGVVLFLVKILRWIVYAILLYITLPILFSIFPFSRDWADTLFNLIWSPLKKVLFSIWNYLPNLFSILVIVLVMRYVIRLVKYIFNEIETGKLNLPGFHSDWAQTTFSLVKFLLVAFSLILIFPYLPGSDSEIFKGVSVFLGVLVSFGSSSVITNIMAGLVLTYMRPFKVGDRIKIGEITGEVVEKTLLVTRLLTIKNEVITIPNSTILSGNTTNYSSETETKGLIIYSSVTIGYDVAWREMHAALIEAADRCELIMHEPKPFVLQTSLDDFYVSYQINAYIKDAGKQAIIYSELHQNIQDVCAERGIEIMSPHYRAERDGNKVTIPDVITTKKS